jgi:hypothetical protein
MNMLRHKTVGVAHFDSEAGHHLRPTALLASLGMSCAHHLRDAAPHILIVLHRTSAVRETSDSDWIPTTPGAAVRVYEWDTGRWFVIGNELGMLGEIEQTGCCYLVSHSTEARGSAFTFRTLPLATAYFDEYAATLTL